MFINEVNISAFGNIKNKSFKFKDGLNLLYGPNESGKTTLFAFIKFIFYGMKVRKNAGSISFKDKYTPWDGSVVSGNLVLTDDNGQKYIISRTCSSGKTDVNVIDAVTGEKPKNIDIKNLGRYFLGLSEESFSSTSFLSDLTSVVKADREGELLKRLTNISQSGHENISFTNAAEILKEEIAVLSSERRKNAVIPGLVNNIKTLENEINILNEQIFDIDKLQKKILEYKVKLNERELELKEYISSLHNHDRKDDLLEIQIANEISALRKSEFLKFNGILKEEVEIINANSAKYKDTNEIPLKLLTIVSSIFTLIGIAGIYNPLLLTFFFVGLLLFTFVFVTSKRIKLYKRIKDILKKYNCETVDELISGIKTCENICIKLKMLEDELKNLKNEPKNIDINVVGSKKTSNDFTIQKNNVKIELLNNEIDDLKRNIVLTEEQLENCKLADIQKKNTESEIAFLKSKLHDAERKLKSLNIAQDILFEAYDELKNEFAPQLADSASEVLSEITDGKYTDILAGDDFSVKIKSGFEYNDSLFYSRGTYEQIYFSMRIALLKNAVCDKVLPLFLDDAFGFYDNDRFINVLKFIYKESHNRQIFISSCRSEEYIYFRNQDINIIELCSERND